MRECKTRAATGKQIACREDRHDDTEHVLLCLSLQMKSYCAAFLFTFTAALPLSAQAPDSREQQQLTTLIRDVQAQQAQIAENQNKIDAKIAELTETMRVARIFAGRAGK